MSERNRRPRLTHCRPTKPTQDGPRVGAGGHYESLVQKAVVTGGAGFIGSHLCDALVERGVDVIVIDDLSTGHRSNLAHLQDHPRVTVHELSLPVAQTELVPLFRGASHVFHLAALADIVPSIERPLDYVRTNVDGTLAALEAARAAAVPRFLYAASSSCYGIPEQYPTREDAPCRPAYPYALTKYLGEQAVSHWGRVYGLHTTCLRLFNVYGPRSRTTGTYGAMFGVFLAQKLAGQPYTVVGDGEQSRDFTYVSDVVDAFLAASAHPNGGDVFNVGTGCPTTVNRITEILGGPRVHIPKRPGEPDRTHADVDRIATVLGWRARIDIETGIAHLLAEIDGFRDAPVWTPETITDATRSWFRYLGGSSGVDAA
ncbi:MAG: NAD-dependent epimerase/dehydratase family protein [Myxococcales bacterium FL481]|nr:MAG: NAD-dependent epimerase/dehydratase family protein [Myxococcales bacterium FL481]